MDLSKSNPDAINYMIQFFYLADYTMPELRSSHPVSHHHVLVYVVADLFRVEPLKRLAAEKFEKHVESWQYGLLPAHSSYTGTDQSVVVGYSGVMELAELVYDVIGVLVTS